MNARCFLSGVTAAVAALCVCGEEVDVTGIQADGHLTWTAPSGSVCRIEWASGLVPADWRADWNDARGILMTNVSGSVAVPRFFRVACNTNRVAMGTPYADESDMRWVRQAYSLTDACPWGFAHDGIDFEPLADGAEFRAVCAGRITDVVLRHAPDPEGTGGNWDVFVELQIDETWAVGYNFEPRTTNLTDGVEQVSRIAVVLLQDVARGDPIGTLYRASDKAHVHVSLWRNGYMYHEGVNVSPEPFFEPDALSSILRLLHARYPGASLSYY